MYNNIINTFLIKQTISNLSDTILNNSNHRPSTGEMLIDGFIKIFSSLEEPTNHLVSGA